MKEPSPQTSRSPSLEENGPTHSVEGVDLTLIRWMLSLTPAERLEVLQRNVWSIMRLRGDDSET